MKRRSKLWLLVVIPPALYLAGIALPAVNGPHLWLGLPSIVWWVCACAVSVSVVLGLLERSHGGDGE